MEKPFAPGERLLSKKERISPERNAFSSGVGKKAFSLSCTNSILTDKNFSLSCSREKLSCTIPFLLGTSGSLSGTMKKQLSTNFTQTKKSPQQPAEGFPSFILYKARLRSSGTGNPYGRGILARVRSALRLCRFHG